MTPDQPTAIDSAIEALISDLAVGIDKARQDDPALANDLWVEMVAAIAQRSPEQVARLERAKGLR